MQHGCACCQGVTTAVFAQRGGAGQIVVFLPSKEFLKKKQPRGGANDIPLPGCPDGGEGSQVVGLSDPQLLVRSTKEPLPLEGEWRTKGGIEGNGTRPPGPRDEALARSQQGIFIKIR